MGLEVKVKSGTNWIWMKGSKCVNKERRDQEGKHQPKFDRTAEL